MKQPRLHRVLGSLMRVHGHVFFVPPLPRPWGTPPARGYVWRCVGYNVAGHGRTFGEAWTDYLDRLPLWRRILAYRRIWARQAERVGKPK